MGGGKWGPMKWRGMNESASSLALASSARAAQLCHWVTPVFPISPPILLRQIESASLEFHVGICCHFLLFLSPSLSPSTPPSTPNFNGIHWRCGFITAGILLPDAPILLLPIDGRLSLVPSFVKPSLSFVIRSVIFPIFPPQSTESKRIPRKNLWIQCAKSEGILPKKKKFNSINK